MACPTRLVLAIAALAACDASEESEPDAGPEDRAAREDAAPEDPGCTPPPAAPWRVVLRDLPGSLVSVWGSGPEDVWAVGGDVGPGPLVLHHDGAAWESPVTGERGSLWWVFGFANGPVYTGGEGGLMLRYRDGAFERIETPSTATVFGIWGPSPDEVWAVGGELSGMTGRFVWRLSGDRFEPAEGLPAQETAAVFKVWGCGADDVWFVGSGGLGWHHDGRAFSETDTRTPRTLFTVHTDCARAAAVGGSGSGTILENDGAGWRDVTPTPEQAPPSGAFQTNGVWLAGDLGYAVGIQGQALRRACGAWGSYDTGLDTTALLHAVWADAEGGVWAVGGRASEFPLGNEGVLIYAGSREPAGASF